MTLEEDLDVVLGGYSLKNADGDVNQVESSLRTLVSKFPIETLPLLVERVSWRPPEQQRAIVPMLRGHLANRRDWSLVVANLLSGAIDPGVKESAARTLEECTNDLHVREVLLEAAVSGETPGIRRAATTSLRKAADLPEVRTILREVAKSSEYEDVRRLAIQSLTDDQALSRLIPGNEGSLRLEVIPRGEARHETTSLVADIKSAIELIRDFGNLTIEQNRILDHEVVPRLEALEYLIAAIAPTLEHVLPARSGGVRDAFLAAGAIGGLIQTLEAAPGAVDAAQASIGKFQELGFMLLALITQ